MKKILSVIKWFLVVAFLVIVIMTFNALAPQLFTSQSSTSALVKDKLVELSQWTTLKYEYSNVIISRFEGTITILGMSEFTYAEEIKMIKYEGYIKAGTDMTLVEVSYDAAKKVMTLKVPHSQILDNVVETEKTTVEDIKGNIFLEYPSQLIIDEINANKQSLVNEKIAQGFLTQADQRITDLLVSFLKTQGYDEVFIEFK